MDTSKLRQVRADLLVEIEALETKAAPVQELLSRRRAQLEALELLIGMDEPASSTHATPGRATSVADAAHAILAKSHAPTHYSQLVEDLTARGIPIPGRDKGTNLIAHLSRDERFARVGSGTYALAEWGLKPMPKRRRAKKARRR